MSTQNLEKSFGAAQVASARLERRVLKGCLGMLKSVPDPRIDRQRRHRLSDILAIAVLTYVSGGDGFRGMGVGPMRKECAWDFDSAKKVFRGGEGEEVAA